MVLLAHWDGQISGVDRPATAAAAVKRIALSLAVLIGLICSTRASAEDRCGGVLMATMTTVMKDRKEMVQKLGFYAIDGGLVMDGKSICTSIRIECSKEDRTCRTATATTHAFIGQPRVIGVMMSDDYRVTEWTRDTISAEMHTPIGGMSYLHIAINDDAPDKVQVINIIKSFISKPPGGEWVTEVLTVANDPNDPARRDTEPKSERQ
jgi:hypothetical protein